MITLAWYWSIVILAAGWFGASFTKALTGYNVADYFIKARKYAEEEGAKSGKAL